ncbi:MAG: hypothetical protein E6199_10795, partial [Mixta calida]|nr:hypothetical protein [Mixta calida]
MTYRLALSADAHAWHSLCGAKSTLCDDVLQNMTDVPGLRADVTDGSLLFPQDAIDENDPCCSAAGSPSHCAGPACVVLR